MHDIAVTGIGVVSPLGVGREAFRESVFEAVSAIGPVSAFDTSAFRSHLGAEVSGFDPARFIRPSVYRRMGRISRMAAAAARMALEDAGGVLDELPGNRIGIALGTAYGGSQHVDEFFRSLVADGPRGAKPFLFPDTVPNASASHIAMANGITGPNVTFCQNGVSVEAAAVYAAGLLDRGLVDAVLVCGAEELTEILYACHDAVGALNPARAEGGSRVTPEAGGGLVLGEGAGALVVERLDRARERGAGVYGLLASAATAGGPAETGRFEKDGRALQGVVTRALAEAALAPGTVDHISVSADFSGEAERLERGVVERVFGDRAGVVGVTPLKYLAGDFGGAGALRAAAILLGIRAGTPLPAIDPDALAGGYAYPGSWRAPRPGSMKNGVMISSTFGGGCACLVFSHPDAKGSAP